MMQLSSDDEEYSIGTSDESNYDKYDIDSKSYPCRRIRYYDISKSDV